MTVIQKRQICARILSEANDLKRTPEALAQETGLSLELVKSVIRGDADLEAARDVALAMSETYPIALSEIWVDPDDTEGGVRIVRAKASSQSSRIFHRTDSSGNLGHYYEYRDTATSRNSPFKPEWIKALRIVDNEDPMNPQVVMNKGHLLHQVTFFLGKVNFYWEINGSRFCAAMNSGDSNYITPFVPHSFASRDRENPGIIIAITYGAEVKRGLKEFGFLRPDEVDKLAGDRRSTTFARVRLRRMMAEESLQVGDVVSRLVSDGISQGRANELINGARPLGHELSELARALHLRPKDLECETIRGGEEVRIARREIHPRSFPSVRNAQYEFRALVRHPTQPHVKAFDMGVSGNGGPILRHHLHQYVYNHGKRPVRFFWGDAFQSLLKPGDSAYIRPMVPHRFERAESGETPHLLVMRVPGGVNDEALDEYAEFDLARRARAICENEVWF